MDPFSYDNNNEQISDNNEQISVSKVFMNFTGNRARYASAVFVDKINLCSWVQREEPFFDEDRAFQWNFITLSLVNYKS